MSTDPKVDLFAQDLFTTLWQQHGFWKVPPKPKPMKSELNEDILKGVQARQALYHKTYLEIFENTHAEFTGSASLFFDTVVEEFPHYGKGNPTGDSVMCLFLSSCAYVADMCMWCKAEGDDFLAIANKAWAMFVDYVLKDSFYEAGGWKLLKAFAKSDVVVYDYVRTFSELVDGRMGKNVLVHEPHLTVTAVESFFEFKDLLEEGSDGPIVLSWVDYCVKKTPTKMISPRFFNDAHGMAFLKIEQTIYNLGRFLNYPCFDSDNAERLECSSNEDDGESITVSAHPEIDNSSSLPTKLVSHTDQKVEFVSGLTTKEPRARSSYPEEEFDARERLKCSPNKDDEESGIVSVHPKIDNASSLPANPMSHNDQKVEFVSGLTAEKLVSVRSEIEKTSNSQSSPKIYIDTDRERVEYISEMKAVQLRNTDPENIQTSKGHEKPVCVRHVAADKISCIEGEEYKDSESRNSVPDKGGENVIGTDKKLEVVDFEHNIVVGELLSSKQLDTKSLKRETEGKAISLSNNNVLPLNSTSLESNEETDRDLKEFSGFSSLGVSSSSLTLFDFVGFSKESDSDEPLSQMNAKPNDIEYFMDQLGPKKVSKPVSTDLKSAAQAYLKNIDSDTIVSDDRIKETPKHKLSTPQKLPLSNRSVSSVLDGTLFEEINFSSSKGTRKKRSFGKENLSPRDSKAKIKMKNPSKSSHTILKSSVSNMEVKGRKSKENNVGKDNSLNQVEGSTCPDSDADTEVLKVLKRREKFENATKLNDPKNILENSTQGYQKISEQTVRQLHTDHCVSHRLKDDEKSPSTYMKIPSSLKASSPQWNCDENLLKFEKSPKIFEFEEVKNESSTMSCIKKENKGLNRQVYKGRSSTETYNLPEDEISSAERTTENPLISASEVDEEPEVPFETRLDIDESSRSVEMSKPAEKEFSKRHDSIQDALQTTETAAPQAADKKRKKRKSKKPLSRLDVRVKEDGDGILDVMRLILVMGHRPGMEYVTSTLQQHEEKEPDCVGEGEVLEAAYSTDLVCSPTLQQPEEKEPYCNDE